MSFGFASKHRVAVGRCCRSEAQVVSAATQQHDAAGSHERRTADEPRLSGHRASDGDIIGCVNRAVHVDAADLRRELRQAEHVEERPEREERDPEARAEQLGPHGREVTQLSSLSAAAASRHKRKPRSGERSVPIMTFDVARD